MLTRTYSAITTKKKNKTKEDIGYSPAQLKQRLEINFTDGMCHNNRGEWHIDHTIPMNHFLKKGITDPKIINALSNLKPRWATTRTINGITYIGNLNKGKNIIYL